jgi:hypothetical protein
LIKDLILSVKNEGKRVRHPGAGLLLFLVIIVLLAAPMGVSASTPPQNPQMSVSVADRTIVPGSGIDISIEWTKNVVEYPIPPDTIGISLYNVSDGSLLETYTIPRTIETDGGRIMLFNGTIPGPLLPAGNLLLVATDPISGENGRVSVNVLTEGASYQAYRSHQVMAAAFFPAAAGIIVVMVFLLGFMIMKKR